MLSYVELNYPLEVVVAGRAVCFHFITVAAANNFQGHCNALRRRYAKWVIHGRAVRVLSTAVSPVAFPTVVH